MCMTHSTRWIRVVPSGRRHKVGNRRIIEAMADAGEPTVIGDQLHYVGTDAHGVVIEIVAVPDTRKPGGLAVIHAMPASFRGEGGRKAMIDPSKYTVTDDDSIEDVDLDTQVVRLKDGRRLTNELAEQLAAKTLAEARRRNLVPGRKSLSGGATHSPRVQFRLPDSLRAAAEKRAAEEGVSLSVLVREALEHYLAS